MNLFFKACEKRSISWFQRRAPFQNEFMAELYGYRVPSVSEGCSVSTQSLSF